MTGGTAQRWLDRARNHERVVALSGSTALMMTGAGMAGPVLPVFARQFGVSIAAVGATVASFGLARLLLNVPLGSLADRRGRRLLLVGGPLVFAAGMAGAGLAGGIVSLAVCRFVSGAGSAMYMTGAIVYLTDISTPTNRGRLIGANQGALLIGQAIGPGVGGLIADRLGIRAPFFVVAVAGLLACVYAFFRLEETRPTSEATRARSLPEISVGWRDVLRSRAFLGIAVINFVIFFTRSGTNHTLMPLQAVSELGLSVGEMGLVLTGIAVVTLLLLPVAATISDRRGRTTAIVPSMTGVAVAVTVIAVAGGVTWFLVGAGILAVSVAVSGPAPAAFAADEAPEEIRGLALGMFRTTGDLGLLVGPPLLGWIADVGGYGLAFGANAAVVVAAAAVFVLIARRPPRRPAR